MVTFTSLEDSPAFEAKVSSKLGSTPFLRHLRTLLLAFVQAPVLHEVNACQTPSG